MLNFPLKQLNKKSMATKIYTRTGDAGKTSLIGGTKVAKSHLRIESYGTLDELNSYLGWVNDLLEDETQKITIKEIQDRLFTIGSSLACDPEKEPSMKLPDLKESDIDFLEKEIDRMNEILPEMKHFIIPGGAPAVSVTHVARCVCRRAERACVHMQEEQMFIDARVIKYLNRLSDYLFVLARHTGYLAKISEITWHPRM